MTQYQFQDTLAGFLLALGVGLVIAGILLSVWNKVK